MLVHRLCAALLRQPAWCPGVVAAHLATSRPPSRPHAHTCLNDVAQPIKQAWGHAVGIKAEELWQQGGGKW